VLHDEMVIHASDRLFRFDISNIFSIFIIPYFLMSKSIEISHEQSNSIPLIFLVLVL
jgi:hypothetical protein